ncbi:DUF4870 domain-containing protein [Hazenella sp. IB182357]|uniref:DUF4870 domain-containing protein n=1 Tax=Polycladospora coralii TaxID=2771432 RepID=A0A926RST4_9BACL|nr:DUF4870 domain-containing protein [Polycladospora coralii]MBD1371865.1 DUF4870 domain-containing protein [Polycladospora coralii]MBS7529326.1 DUF4870 domain-containing protein [Polycladospora coralii]
MDSKGLKVLVHASTWFAPIVVPLIVYVVITDKEVRRISMQALIFHIIMSILIFISSLLSFVLIGIPFLIAFAIMALIYPIIGIIRAINEEHFDYPLTRMFVK